MSSFTTIVLSTIGRPNVVGPEMAQWMISRQGSVATSRFSLGAKAITSQMFLDPAPVYAVLLILGLRH